MKNVFYKGLVIKSLTAQDNKLFVSFRNSTEFMYVAFCDTHRECSADSMALISENKNVIGKTIKYTDFYSQDVKNKKYIYIDLFLYREIFGFKIPIFPVVETYIYEYKKNMNFLKKDLENSK